MTEENYVKDELFSSEVEEKVLITTPEKITNGPRHMRIPLGTMQTDRFLTWCGTAEYRTWTLLAGYIIRQYYEKGSLMSYLHKKYYLNGKLVARWSYDNMAAKLGLKSRNSVVRQINSLVAKGYIEKETIAWKNRRINVYIMGEIDPASGWERLTAFQKIYEENLKAKLEATLA